MPVLSAPTSLGTASVDGTPRPLSLLCELTYRCNLQCPYCYNPLNLREYRDELSTQEWSGVLSDAAELRCGSGAFLGR